ncbi:helix-turn-helix transcriptional regulator [Acidaminobacter sp. JC074]|uniref:helix-turn-helix domain-containing protein n=1 Tax=Acidaminobacter sp. JC074 TaxID=2530199 RepID=UPI001F0F1DB7|nr:AraC family transcriptional regulator [Acidaminobacter sp. JC074]MCH4888000.1 helix-turn-helix transcriptional regulator [Acidaminobacter sp. JC074]
MDEKKLAVRIMQDYIEAHLHETITLKNLGDSCFLSPSYASKIFRELTGFTPYNYIKQYRLSKAAKQLRDQDKKVLDVALDFVFDSHEGFTRAFSKQFGIPPKKYAMKKPPIKWFLPYPVTIEKEAEMSNFIFTQVIERPKRKLMILRAKTAKEYFKYCDEVGCDVWGILMSVKEALYEPAGFWLSDNLIKEGASEYVQGVELPLDYDNEIPEGFEIIELPPSKIMVFQSEPYDDDNFMTEVSAAMKAIKDFKPEIYGYTYDTSNPRFQLEPRGERGYIEGWPVKDI